MSNLALFTNNASTLLASGITNASTVLAVTPTTGTSFPLPGANQIAVVTVEDVSGNIEIMWCTGRSGDNLTVTRAQEGTAALAFSSGSRVELRVTAGSNGSTAGGLTNFLQKNGGDTMAGTTNVNGVLQMAGAGSLQGGEFAGGRVRSAAGVSSGEIFVSGGQPFSGAGNAILTAANITSNIPAGFDFVRTGMILIWSGSSGTVPAGWHICDGTTGTVDLRDWFILGAGGAQPTTGGTFSGGLTSVVSVGTITDSHILVLGEIPAHHHNYWGPTANSNVASGGGKGWDWGVSGSSQLNTPSGSFNAGQQFIQDTGGGAGHTHGLSGTSHQHTTPVPIPPYKALFYIQKL